MEPRFFLQEECRSVRAALNETLRHDYGPDRSREYFEECRTRLAVVERALRDAPDMDQGAVAAHMQTLSALSSRISLIERAHLGEFSWPFAETLRDMAGRLFTEESFGDDAEDELITPIVHVVAEGADYQIVNDPVTPLGERPIIIVAFPRQLKHCVLLHSIFGHELGHTAMDATRTGGLLKTKVLPFLASGSLADGEAARAWLRSQDAPSHVQKAASDGKFEFRQPWLDNWYKEILCDLFGLRLFGPSFTASHRTIIGAMCPDPDYFDVDSTTHPPYPVRQAILSRAMRLLGWDQPTQGISGDVLDAEKALLAYTCGGDQRSWFLPISNEDLQAALKGIEQVLALENLGYTPIDPDALKEMVSRLALERPPGLDGLGADGKVELKTAQCAHVLHAGWVYWFGRAEFKNNAAMTDPEVEELDFDALNRLCDQSLLQQAAIGMAIGDYGNG